MADPKSFPKYAHLSGIAYDQPDVYETEDLPEADQIRDDSGEDSEAVESLQINAPEAFSRFKNKVLTSDHVDFSDRVSRRSRSGYGVGSREWEIVGAGEKETSLQKYERLKCEIKQLAEELSTAKEDESNDISNREIAAHLGLMNRQLEELSLDKSFGADLASNLSDPQGSQIKKLIFGLEKSAGKSHPEPRTSGKGDASDSIQTLEVKYKVNPKSHQVQMAQTARIADLEARINRLNALVATNPETLRKLGGPDRSLIENSRWVAGKVALLDTSQLDAIEARMASLLAKMDQLAEKSSAASGASDTDRKKIHELYELVKSAEEMSQLIPGTLDRMVALEGLQVQGTSFKASLNQVECTEQLLSNTCEESKVQLKQLETNFAHLEAQMKKTLEAIEARINGLAATKKKK